jgi:hypothetical protein
VISVIISSLILSVVTLALPNNILIWHSYIIFAIQAAFIFPTIWKNIVRVKDIFLPSLFSLIYFSVNLTLGAFLIPREYGADKQFATTLIYINDYNLIIPFFIICNLVLCALSVQRLQQLNALADNQSSSKPAMLPPDGLEIPKIVLYAMAFSAVGYFDIISAYSFQFSLMIVHLSGLVRQRSILRYPAYLIYLGMFIVFSSENKREIAMALFLIVFFEAYILDIKTKIRAKSLAIYAGTAAAFFFLIIWASVLRGYGEYPVKGPVDAVRYVPDYILSDSFVDGITENLELNYNYGVTITAADYVLNGNIPYQYGTSFLKIVYLPIPREVFPNKPESVLQIFTKSYAPGWWAVGGSMPVIFSAEMFVNFSYFALIIVGLVMFFLDSLFVSWHRRDSSSVVAHCYLFLSFTVLMLARGSGVEQYALYFFFALPVFVFFALTRSRTPSTLRQSATF